MTIQPALFGVTGDDFLQDDWSALVSEPRALGAVFTRRSVVDFILDLVGYVSDKPLHSYRLLEPSCGDGGFVEAAAERLLRAWSESSLSDTVLDHAIRAVELNEESLAQARRTLHRVLLQNGVSELSATRILREWLLKANFLLEGVDGEFDFVVGNPPYVRQELLHPAQLATYRATFRTMVGRSDLYVPFFELSLGLLAKGGNLGFICADAWTKNEYGRELRRLVTSNFCLKVYVDLYGLDAFESPVGAYPSVTVIGRGGTSDIQTVRASSVESVYLSSLAQEINAKSHPMEIFVRPSLPAGPDPWLLAGVGKIDVLRDIESRHEPLEKSGCRVGIGVATGADKVFIAPLSELDVEDSRKLPLAVNRDVVNGSLVWHGMGVVNPWQDDGGLVDLSEYPKLAHFLGAHRQKLSQRHTAKDDPNRRWYKTIDRITPSLTWQPKLLIPDIRGDGDAICYDEGTVYPHHNLYYITSDSWDLWALQALLRSGLARLFVEAYAVKIGGGYLRFQAQYLRRIRIPRWTELSPNHRALLSDAGANGVKVSVETLEQIYGVKQGSFAFMEEWQ